MKTPSFFRGEIFLAALGTLASFSFSALPTGVVLKTFYDTNKVNLKASLVKPVSIAEVPGLPKHLYVVDLKGKLWGVFPDTTGYGGLQWVNYTGTNYKKMLLADFSNVTHYSAEGEAGGYSVCFHPLYAQNHKFYIYYYKNDSAWAASLPKYYTGAKGVAATPFNGEDPFGHPAGSVVLDEYQANATADTVTKLREVFRWHQQPAVGGGTAKFGPDGYLYMTSGSYDGNGRNYHIDLNKVMRIDVDHMDPGRQYAIPSDNPFASSIDPNNPYANMIFPATTDPDTSFKREIWAAGFRNPWTTAFDPDSGTLYLGDVDEDQHEEINIVTKGGNYGWGRGGDLNNLGDGNYGQTGPVWSFSGNCATAANPNHKPGADSCKYFMDPAYSASRSGAHALQCVIVGTVFHGAKTSPFYGYLLGTDNTLDTLWAFKKGDAAPQSIGHPTQFGSNVNHRGIGSMASGVDGTVYAAALDWYDPANRTDVGTTVYYELYQVTSPDMTLKSYSDVTTGVEMENQRNQEISRMMDPARPRLIVNLGFSLADRNAGKVYDLMGRLKYARQGTGVYYVKPQPPGVGLYSTPAESH